MDSRIEGLADLDRQLRELGAAVGGKVLRGAVGEAIKPALARARATVPLGTRAHRTYKGRLVAPGFASRSLRVKTVLSRDRRTASALLGVRREAFYALQFLELGTAKIPRKPWLVPAFEATLQEQLDRLSSAIRTRILKSIARAKR